MLLKNILLIIHLIFSISIVVIVLLQHGKDSYADASFSGGSSQSLFGARGYNPFLSKITTTLVSLFFFSSLILAYLYTREREETSVITASSTLKKIQELNADPE